MPKQIVDLTLKRKSNEQFGFRIIGGKDEGLTLKVEKVFLYSPAEEAGLKPYDFLVSVQGQKIFEMKHDDVVKLIQKAGPTLELSVERGDHIVPNFEEIWPSGKKQKAEEERKKTHGVNYVLDAMQSGLPGKDFNGFTTCGRPKVATKQYDNPLFCYSEDTIEEMTKSGHDWKTTAFTSGNVQQRSGNYLGNSAVLACIRDHEKGNFTQAHNKSL